MAVEGGCYCKNIRYVINGEPILRGLCYCRECQYFTGGGPNFMLAVSSASFSYTKGTPSSFKRTDVANSVTREFCSKCGTHIITKTKRPGVLVVKAGTLDSLAFFGKPTMAINTIDKQSYHQIPEGIAVFERLPPEK